VSSFGKTVEEANENLEEALLLYLEGIEELKIRDQIFKEKSVTFCRKKESYSFLI